MKDTEQPRSRSANRLYWALWIACALLLVADPLVHKHGEFAFEEWFGFHALFGVVAALLLVVVARVLRALVKRPEDYHDRR